ncbi:hypothetical protein E0Z06_09775 [Rheinheimera sp. D18]|uniref:hypothetical protein n=1 Tax=Rheinheimera sp. D18 TaxID=2545632 RepID=UPI001042889B|nr:hypothetical protein [Rheinheimera sp. D18]QBL09784.1 hypothetical protein E0Z06_09775 [Rheinheimera sp. D18]
MTVAQTSAAQRTTLLLVVAFLLYAKFILQPWYQQQQQSHDMLALTSQQLIKAKRVVNLPPAASDSLQQLVALRQSTEQRFLVYRNDAEFRLQAQQQLEQHIRKYAANLTVFEWLTVQDEAGGYLRSYRARLTLEGALPGMLNALQAAHEQLVGVQLLENTLYPDQRSATGHGRMVVMLQIAAVKHNAEEPK